MEEAEEFLFASGNIKYWLVVTREELVGADGGKYYDNSPVTVTASSGRCQPYQGDHSLFNPEWSTSMSRIVPRSCYASSIMP